MEDAIEITGFTADPALSPSSLMNEMRLEHDSLRVVAEETGGLAILNQNDFRTAFSRILEDNSSYYVLGYYPTNDKRDGRFRKVEVRVKKPGLRVRARRGYVAPVAAAKKEIDKGTDGAAKTSPDLREALDSPLPVSGLTVTAFAAPFKGTGNNVAVAMAIEVDGVNMAFKQDAKGLFANNLEVALYAADVNSGKIKDGVRDIISLTLKPQTLELVRSSAFRVVRRIQVPPGKYQLRIGARESGGKIGSIIYDLDAPDFSKGALSMSGIAISSGSSSTMMTASPDPSVNEFKDVLPGPPTASREFPRGDTLAVFAEVYDNVPKTPHRVEIVAAVLADDGKVVHTTSDIRKSEELQGATGGYGYTTKIPLAGMAPGRYVLRLTAKSMLGNSQPVTREVEFRVK
jgi:hypothetical protein